MPTSSFKLFDENKANMLTDSEYSSNAQRLNGVQSGVASSKLQNKFQYQASLVAYAIAQLMVQNGYDATDSTAVTTFVNNMSNTMLQKVVDKATDAQAKEGTNTTKWMTPALVKSAITELAPMVSSILSNETKALYGLGESAVPDNVLAGIGKYKQYWWQRRVNVDNSHYVGNVTTVAWSGTQFKVTYRAKRTIYYSDSYTVDSTTGAITLDNQQSVTCSDDGSFYASNPQSLLLGKWCLNLYEKPTEVVYIPADATIKSSSNSNGDTTVYLNSIGNYKKVDVTFVENSEVGDWGYVQSSNRNAYPDSGTQDGYEYEYLGIPFDNAVTASKIETGSYVGTGTYGESNPNTLTFGFKPKFVWIYEFFRSGSWYDAGDASKIPFELIPEGEFGRKYPPSTTPTHSTNTYSKRVGSTLYWYNTDSAGDQLNYSNSTYYYIAIG